MSLPHIPGPYRGGGRKFHFTLSTAFLVLTVACFLSFLFFGTPFGLAVVRWIANGIDTATYRIPHGFADDLEYFQTEGSVWMTCCAATVLLTIPLAVATFLLGPSRGFLAFWFLSLGSLALFAVAVLVDHPMRGAALFFVPLATGAACYLSGLYGHR